MPATLEVPKHEVPKQIELKLGITSPEGFHALNNHPTQSATTMEGWKSAIFGLPFMAAGIFIELIARHPAHPGRETPAWFAAGFAALFFLGGLFFFVHGLAGMARGRAYRRQLANDPGEPWLADHQWRREGIAFSAFHEMLRRLFAAMMWTAFLVPFGWVGLNVHGAWVFLVGTSLFGLFGLIFWYRWAAMLLDLLRYGNSYLSYEAFPFFLGGTLNVRLRAPRHVAALDALTLTLRCVEEQYVTTGAGRDRTTSVVCYERYKDALTFDRDHLTGLAGGDVPAEFRLPADQPPTALINHPPMYWEIEAKGNARGADYSAFFLVPVY
ncbi:MAG TPA: hypothetical protein VN661_10515, partial [Candidatus Acidoferrales bacterium]|nr:hypothetical protein [Candidatus Acidoferrales bacterium]